MKILLCTPTFDNITHGPSKFANILLQINELYPNVELRILTEDTLKAIPNRVYKININYPRLVHSLGIFLRMFSYHFQAQKIKKEYDYDIVIYNNAIVGLWSAIQMSKKIKVVGMLNDDDYLSSRISNFDFSKLKLIFLIHKPFEYLTTKFLDLVIVNSNYLKRQVEKEYGTSSKKVQHLYKSIQLYNFQYKDHSSIDLKNVKILFVKSDYIRGGLQLLVNALSLLPEYNFILSVIGPEKNKKQHIDSYVQNKNNIKLYFLGVQTQKQVFHEMRQNDILCIPSFREGLGVANIEGLATGIPIVSTKIGGIPEVLDYGNNGWLVEYPLPEYLAKTIKNCLELPDERYLKSKKGVDFVKKNFNHLNMIECLLKILESIE